MSAPASRTSCQCTPLSAPWVPTGMKAGVRTTPRGVRISPVRAAPSVLMSENENASAIGLTHRPMQQAGIAVGVEAIAVGDRVRIGALHHVEPAERGDQHEQG